MIFSTHTSGMGLTTVEALDGSSNQVGNCPGCTPEKMRLLGSLGAGNVVQLQGQAPGLAAAPPIWRSPARRQASFYDAGFGADAPAASMTTTTKVAIGAGIAAVLGLGIYFARK